MAPLVLKDSKIVNFMSNKFFLLISICVFFFLLDYCYQNTISPRYLDYGLFYKNLNLETIFFSLSLCLVPILFLPSTITKPSDVSIWLLYLIPYFSTIYLTWMVFEDDKNSFLLSLLLLASLLIMNFTRKIRLDELKEKAMTLTSKPKSMYFFFILFFLTLIFSLSLSGGSLLNLDFSSVYSRRLEARNVNIFGHGYILSFGRSVLCIFSIYFFLKYRKIRFLILLILFSLAVFSFDGTKSSIILPIVIAFWSFVVLKFRKSWVFPISMLALAMVTIFEYQLRGTFLFSDYLLRRIMIIPGMINTMYWDYFSVNENVYLTDSILKLFLDPVYELKTPYLIGEIYMPGQNANANTGIWLGGYAHFGVLGMLAVSIIAGILLALLDLLAEVNFFALGVVSATYIGINWSEQMIHTSVLTGGILFIFLSLAYYRSRNLSKWKAI